MISFSAWVRLHDDQLKTNEEIAKLREEIAKLTKMAEELKKRPIIATFTSEQLLNLLDIMSQVIEQSVEKAMKSNKEYIN